MQFSYYVRLLELQYTNSLHHHSKTPPATPQINTQTKLPRRQAAAQPLQPLHRPWRRPIRLEAHSGPTHWAYGPTARRRSAARSVHEYLYLLDVDRRNAEGDNEELLCGDEWQSTWFKLCSGMLLWSPYVIGQTIIFSCCGLFFFLSFFLLSFFSSPNLSGRRLDVYHTLAHGVALVRI